MATESKTYWLERCGCILCLTGTLLLLSIQASAVAEAPTTPAESAGLGSLVVFPEGSDLSGVSGVICVMRDGNLLQSQNSRFDEPVVFQELPEGNVSVVISPVLDQARYVRGEANAEITAGGQTKLRLQCQSLEATLLKLKVVGFDGQPLTNAAVLLKDTTTEGIASKQLLTTNDQGEARCFVCRGQSYVASVRIVRSEVFTLHSDAIKPKDKTEEVKWVLKYPPMVRIALVRNNDDGKRLPAKDMTLVRIFVDGKKSAAVSVRDGLIELSKEAAFLQGAEQMQVQLIRTVGENTVSALDPNDGIISLSKGKDQEVTLSIVPARTAEVTFESSNPHAVAYLSNDKDELYCVVKPGRSVTLRYGGYSVYWIAPGAVIDHSEFRIDSRDPKTVTYRFNKAGSLAGKLYSASGEPVKDAVVAICYLKLPQVPLIEVDRTDNDGAYQVPIDVEQPMAVAIESALGGKVVVVAPEHTGVLNVRLARPVQVTGKVTLPPSFGQYGTATSEIIWFDAARPEIRVGQSIIEDGKYSALLQPGKYKMSLFCVGEIADIGEVTINPEQLQVELKSIDVNNAMWEAKRPAQARIVR